MMRITETVKHLLIINVIFFVATYVFANINGVGFEESILIQKLALFYPSNPNFGYWQYVSSMFMHGSLMHIFFNMFALASFGSALESMWGRNKFLFFYFATGIGAGLLYTLVNYYQFNSVSQELFSLGMSPEQIQTMFDTGKYPTSLLKNISEENINILFLSLRQTYFIPALGASGALYGVLVAFAFKFPNAELGIMFIPVPVKAKYFVPIILTLDLFFGLAGKSIFGGNGTGIAHFAHLGGALTGYLLMLYYHRNHVKRWD